MESSVIRAVVAMLYDRDSGDGIIDRLVFKNVAQDGGGDIYQS